MPEAQPRSITRTSGKRLNKKLYAAYSYSLWCLRLINHEAGIGVCADKHDCVQKKGEEGGKLEIHGFEFCHGFISILYVLGLFSSLICIIKYPSLYFYSSDTRCKFDVKNGVKQEKTR